MRKITDGRNFVEFVEADVLNGVENSDWSAHAPHDTRALQTWLGHRNIQHTVRYTELAPDRFKNFWR